MRERIHFELTSTYCSQIGSHAMPWLPLRNIMLAEAVLLLRNFVTALQCGPEAR